MDQIYPKSVSPAQNRKIAFSHAFMVITYYIKLFFTGADRHSCILMSFLLLAAETKWAKEKNKMIPFWVIKPEEKRNSATIMIPVDGKWTVFLVKLKLPGESFN